MIPNPTSDPNLIKEHQFYDSSSSSHSLASTSPTANTINSDSIISVIQRVITFDTDDILSMDNFLRLVVISSMLMLLYSFFSSWLRRRRSFEKLREKAKPSNMV
ncbi:hypothetical protein FOB58_004873 [Candida parapsilosis]|uniref:Uncharacterized protein n=2 Tax=Candida parapsilosis TaxID=5480 RepID=G8BHQ7_CANPC|nr:uncharacterized protein CPAR2_502070 [Candida parapsilosis]KAF6044588.1 hypothetical protein FOB58_004873 [Candida parapsilosis]KAF6045025.1 hypothetical protein FOB59_004501 [Candida parapsilosis]KAF6048829.1 hypothetical protein FOB60_004213 [Candida parapsilosis]KAF6060829.1 hypothetical protein FOB61_004838 [Candida parapsilosis]KAI5900902.1 hypothetical protein K4G60_g26 [Candida parapsilosis]